jgi:RHS repeat-associated protein
MKATNCPARLIEDQNAGARPRLHLLALTTVWTVWAASFGLHAQEFDPSEWDQQTKTYNYRVPIANGPTVSGTLESDDFPFTPSPGNCQAVINFAHMDDDGSIGGVEAPSSGHNCDWPHAPIVNAVIPANAISVIGNRLSVNAYAVDNGCGVSVGWSDVSITWKALCTQCAKCTQPGNAQCQDKCVKFDINLGKDMLQDAAGQLDIYTNFPSPLLAQPAGLGASLSPTTESILQTGTLRQVRTSSMLADIIASNCYSYTVSLYSATNFDPYKIGGLYAPIGQPYDTFVIQNPDGSTNDNRLQIDQSGILGTHEYDYVWVAASQRWDLTTGGGLRTETRTKDWDVTQTFLTETDVVMNSDSSIAFKQIETYELFPWNQTNLIQRIVNPDGSWPQTNTWTYYTDATDTNDYSQLEQITQPNGYWETYTYDSFGRMIKKVAQFEDAATNASDSQCRVTTYGYGYGIGDGSEGVITTNVETLLSQEIGRSYFVDFFGGTSNIVCQTPGAGMSATDNLITVTLTYTNGPFTGWNYLTQNPDGTVSVYQYSTNSIGLTTVTYTGAPDDTGTNVIDGTETIVVTDLGGNSVSNATYDVASGLLLSSSVTLQTDQLGRPTLVQNNDGTTVATQFGCCGLESQTDQDGVTTAYNYDALNRVSSITSLGITTSYTYDAAGRTLTTTREGTDGSEIVQNISTYDPTGWLLTSTNALNNGTLYGQYLASNGNTMKTTTNADGGISIETDYQDGSVQTLSGSAVFGVSNVYGVEIPAGETAYRAYTQQIDLDTNGAPTSEWTKTYTDMAGRNYKTAYPDGSASQSVYNNVGQLVDRIDPDGVTVLYQYNNKGQLDYTATDMNTNGVIDFDGTDRITETVNDVLVDKGTTVNRTRIFVWNANGSPISNLVSSVETSADGLQSWNVIFDNTVGVTNHTVTSYDQNLGYRIFTATAPDGSTTINTYQFGRLIATTSKDANGVQIGQTAYAYDAQGRRNIATDARNGATTTFYNNADQQVATVTPSPDGIQSGQLTTNILDNMGRVIQTINPDATVVTNFYFANGLCQETCGSRTYPVQFTYDYAGRMKTMTTWTNFAIGGGAAVTTWNYDALRGFMTNKAYADGKGPCYTFTAAGRLKSRLWACGVSSTNFYDNAGGLVAVIYSDLTPGVTNSYDRLSRLITTFSGGTTDTMTYNDADEPLSEAFSGGPLNALSVTNGYDNLLRRTNVTVNSAATLVSTSYGYDAASRLSTVSDGTNSAAYTYLANSSLAGQVTFVANGVDRMITTKQYDYLNRLAGVSSTPSGGGIQPFTFNYTYNLANQRTGVTNADNSYWVYQYNSLGQVVSGKKYWADGTPVAGQQFTYNFDTIGNRTAASSGGDSSGNNLRTANYTNNVLNELVGRDVPSYISVLGSANSNSTVTVNLQSASRYGNYFRAELTNANTSAAIYQSLTNLAVFVNGTNDNIICANLGNALLLKTPQTFAYDLDGNLTNDGQFSYSWDAENRLTNVTSLSGIPADARIKLDLLYDWRGRRIQKILSTNNGISFVAVSTNRYIYDGWNLVAVLTPNSQLQSSYLWGNDLSGSLQGAGGVDGLLEVSTMTTNCFVAYDGNGNVAVLVNAANGTVTATYEYGPFGETIRASGPMAKANQFQFSTKFEDESGLLYYGCRFYDPEAGRWPNRDPIGERGGINLYDYVGNNPINWEDPYGLALYPPNFVGPLQPRDSRIPYPPSNIPGGPWTWSSNPQNSRGGDFIGPKQPTGPRTRCTYAPPGTVNNNKNPYWKDSNGQRYDVNGKPITPEEAHPSPNTPPPTVEPEPEPTPTEPELPELPEFPFFDI